MASAELEEFRRQIDALATHALLSAHIEGTEVRLAELELNEIDVLARIEAGYYFLLAAAGLNRTSLRLEARTEAAQIVTPRLRRAYAFKAHLPVRQQFGEVATKAVALRSADLGRKRRGEIEALFRERLKDEGIPIAMSPPRRQVPGILIAQRKPDGVYPDPVTGRAPAIYLEIKNIRRVADDIQKRLYEIAEASLEMKYLYGNLELRGLDLDDTTSVAVDPELRQKIRAAITTTLPVVVAVFLCPKAEAERYRVGAEAFIDRLFFQEEIEECLDFLRNAVRRADTR
jgi:hypothetical protein